MEVVKPRFETVMPCAACAKPAIDQPACKCGKVFCEIHKIPGAKGHPCRKKKNRCFTCSARIKGPAKRIMNVCKCKRLFCDTHKLGFPSTHYTGKGHLCTYDYPADLNVKPKRMRLRSTGFAGAGGAAAC